jgi:hypothetical protein
MNRGYVKLWRRSIDSAVFADPHLWQLWTWCLMRANHKTLTVPVRTGRGQTIVTLKSGEFIFGRHAAAKDLKCPASTLYDRMLTLKKLKMVVTQPGTHYSVITIVNWDSYQNEEEADRQATRIPTRHPTGTDKNVKNERLTGGPSKDAGAASGKILGYDTVGRPLYAEPAASEAAR